MKHYFVFALTLALSSSIFAQSEKELKKHRETVDKSWEKGTVEWSLDTLFNKGEPYCLMRKEKMSALRPPNFTVANLDGTEVIFVKFDQYEKPGMSHLPSTDPNKYDYFYTFNFLADKTKVEADITSLDRTEFVGKLMVKAGLFQDGALDDAAKEKFELGYGRKHTDQHKDEVKIAAGNGGNNGNGSGKSNSLIARDKNGLIVAAGGNILQANVLVGKFKESNDPNMGKLTKVLIITLPNGQEVATARSNDVMNKEWTITTAKDNMTHELTVSPSSGTYWNAIAKFLINKYYL